MNNKLLTIGGTILAVIVVIIYMVVTGTTVGDLLQSSPKK
jgi:hypothetical protein